MSQRKQPAAKPSFSDPRSEPLKVVDVVSFHPLRGQEFDVTLYTLISNPVDEHQTLREPVVAARLRLNVGLARAIIPGLSRHVATAEAATAVKN